MTGPRIGPTGHPLGSEAERLAMSGPPVPEPPAPWWKRYAKALLGVLATLTPSAVIGVLALVGVDVDTDTAVLICGVLGALLGGATVARVGNAPQPAKTAADGAAHVITDAQPPRHSAG